MTATQRWRRCAARAVGLTVMALMLASCTAVSAATKTQEALTDRGFSDVSVRPQPMSDATLLRVSYTTTAADVTALTKEFADVAKIVWQAAPMHFDAVDISAKEAPDACTQSCLTRFDRAALVAAHGPRDPDLDKDARTELLGAAGLLVAVVVAALVLTVIMLTRARRRPARPWAYTPPGWTPRSGSAPPTGPPPPPGAPSGSPLPPRAPTPARGYGPPATAAERASAHRPVAWPPQSPPPAYEPPPPPLVVPTHDIWARPPS